jgi:hypothetical protein
MGLDYSGCCAGADLRRRRRILRLQPVGLCRRRRHRNRHHSGDLAGALPAGVFPLERGALQGWRFTGSRNRGPETLDDRKVARIRQPAGADPLLAQSTSSNARRIRSGRSAGSSRSLELSSSTMAGGAASALRDAAVVGQSMVPSPGHRCSSFMPWLSCA